MAAAATDLLQKVGTPGTATTLAAPGYTTGVSTSITVGSTTNWPSDTGVSFAIDVVDSSGVQVPGTYCEFVGTVASATSVIGLSKTFGTAQNYAAGATTRVYIPVSSTRENRLVTWGLAHANQDGSLLTSAVQSALSLGTGSLNGWNALGYAPNSVTANGNRSYDLVFNGNDLTGTLSAGMRLRTTRTVVAPTQCTNLNGTTQYFSKTSPAGMTFTNNFVVGAWVKPTSYTASVIASRYNGTSGWALFLEATGQLTLRGYNAGSANFSHITTYQSVPLNKWSHIALQLDMSTFTATTTTSYAMIDGVDVPAQVARAGTNPTALVQAGNLEIGSWNGGLLPFPGKLAQPFVSSAKITQANVKTLYSQGLTPALITANSIISAYSLSNSSSDLNTTNANNLTSNGSATTTTNDAPFGVQADGTNSTTLDYAIIQKASFSTNTTVTVQVPEGGTIPTSGGVSAVVYSGNGKPYNFPSSKNKWIIDNINKIQNLQNPAVGGTWYNIGSPVLQVPVGSWRLRYRGVGGVTGSGALQLGVGLSTTAAVTPTEVETRSITTYIGSSASEVSSYVGGEKAVDTSASTAYYLNIAGITGTVAIVYYGNSAQPSYIEAENAYI